jgi:hypothetical protein
MSFPHARRTYDFPRRTAIAVDGKEFKLQNRRGTSQFQFSIFWQQYTVYLLYAYLATYIPFHSVSFIHLFFFLWHIRCKRFFVANLNFSCVHITDIHSSGRCVPFAGPHKVIHLLHVEWPLCSEENFVFWAQRYREDMGEIVNNNNKRRRQDKNSNICMNNGK